MNAHGGNPSPLVCLCSIAGKFGEGRVKFGGLVVCLCNCQNYSNGDPIPNQKWLLGTQPLNLISANIFDHTILYFTAIASSGPGGGVIMMKYRVYSNRTQAKTFAGFSDKGR